MILLCSAQNVTFALKKMEDVITCNVTTANMTFVGCAWVIGKLMAASTTNALGTRKILILLMRAYMHRQEKL